jgi:signal transduction histidine kinase
METEPEEHSRPGRSHANRIERQNQQAEYGLGSSGISFGAERPRSVSALWGSPVSRAWVRELAGAATEGRILAFAALGSLVASAIVAYATAVNPNAVPAGPAGWLARAAYVLAPAAVGIYVWRLHPEERLGRLLVAFAAAAALWTLNGAADPALFGVARLAGVFVAPLLSYLVLSFPEGRLHSRLEGWVVAGSGALVALGWIPLVFITAQPVIVTPLVRCAPHCPHNAFFVGAAPGVERALEAGVRFGYAVMLVGVVALLLRRLLASTAPMRRMLVPVLVASILYAGALALYLAAQSRGATVIAVSGWIVILTVPMIPLALLLGFARERVFVRSALARLVTVLPGLRDSGQVGDAMSAAFKDESLQVLSWQAADGRYVDRDGTPVSLPGARASLAVTKVESDGEPLAAIVYDSALSDDFRFIRAIAEAAMLGVANTQLESDLQGSRLRLVRTASLTRERLARDLHDGAQQHLVAARLRVELAADAIDAGSQDAAAMVRRLGEDLEEALEALRRLSQGMSPPLLDQHGLERALRAAALRSTLPTTVKARGIARYSPEVEAAVYFSCVEALQNAAKHAGADASINLTLSDDHRTLRFEVADTGVGFDQRLEGNGSGLTHIRDRVGAVRGHVTVSSSPDNGTSISAAIPVSDKAAKSPI